MNNAPSTLIEQAMQRSGQIARQAAEDHWHAFTAQMQERVGVEKITLDEPYLPFLLARSELRYLYRMARLEQRLIDEKSSDCCAEHKDDPMPMGAQIERETNRAIIETKQALDAARQQSFGIGEYVWQGGECSECAPKDGQTFSWGEGEVPGSVHPNCNCSADPILEGAGDPNPPEVTPEDIAEAALLLASLIPVVGAWSRGLAVVRSLGSVGRRILERVGRNEETPVEPSNPSVERPNNVPKNWEQKPADKGEGTKYVELG